MSRKKPEPLYSQPPRKICPICGEPSYSRGGMHPQCAAADADAKLMKAMKASNQGKLSRNHAGVKSVQIAARRFPRLKTCDCGQELIGKTNRESLL